MTNLSSFMKKQLDISLKFNLVFDNNSRPFLDDVLVTFLDERERSWRPRPRQIVANQLVH